MVEMVLGYFESVGLEHRVFNALAEPFLPLVKYLLWIFNLSEDIERFVNLIVTT